MAVRIVWRDLPELVKPEAERMVSRWLRYLPGWVTTFTVSYDATDNENICTVGADHMHRRAHVFICPPMWDLDEQERDRTFLHELAHAIHSPVDEAFAQIIETKMSRAAAERVYSDAVECYCNDFAALAWEVSCGT